MSGHLPCKQHLQIYSIITTFLKYEIFHIAFFLSADVTNPAQMAPTEMVVDSCVKPAIRATVIT